MNTLYFSAPTNLPKIFSRRKGRIRPIRRALLFFAGLTFSVVSLFGQTFHTISPLDAALAGSVTARSGDIRYATGNPASLINPDNNGIFAAFTPSALGIDEYREGSFIGATSFGNKVQLGLVGTTLGAGDYRESSAGIILTGNLHNRLTTGLKIAAHNLSIRQYGSRTLAALDIGMLVNLGATINAGASFTNITRAGFDPSPLPQRLALGLLYTPDTTLSLSLDISQELTQESGVAFALMWTPIQELNIRCGIGSEPHRVGYGIGYRIGDVVIDYGGSYTSPLGFRHTFGTGLVW